MTRGGKPGNWRALIARTVRARAWGATVHGQDDETRPQSWERTGGAASVAHPTPVCCCDPPRQECQG